MTAWLARRLYRVTSRVCITTSCASDIANYDNCIKYIVCSCASAGVQPPDHHEAVVAEVGAGRHGAVGGENDRGAARSGEDLRPRPQERGHHPRVDDVHAVRGVGKELWYKYKQ